MDETTLADEILQGVIREFGGIPEVVYTAPNTGDLRPSRGLSVMVDELWIPADLKMWRAWTGRRAVWGLEFHGDVYAVDSEDDSTPFTGARTCACDDCQRHVTLDERKN